MGINHIIIDIKNLTEDLIPNEFNWKYHIDKNRLTIETNKPDEDMSKIINF